MFLTDVRDRANPEFLPPDSRYTMKKLTRRRRSTRYGISRIDQPSTRTHGWFVRVGYHARRDGSYGARHTRFFGDVTNGGQRKALRAAEKYVKSVHKPAATRRKAKRKP
jgi:hypothetical protein